MNTVRRAAVAGSFYPADPKELRLAVAGHLSSAGISAGTGGGCAPERPPKLLVVPHAGYVFSGDMAALAYAPLARWRGKIKRVVVLGPAHREPVRGLAAPTVGGFETPLGRVPLDDDALCAIESLRQVVWTDLPHAQEHSIEVQLPFLQAVLGDTFQLVPLAVGQASPAVVAEVLERVWGGDETLIIISSDLSHFLPSAHAQVADRATVRRILHFATDLQNNEACGAVPLNGALLAARRHGLVPRLLGLCNSAESTGGDSHRVVGYGAIAFDAAADVAQSSGDAALGPVLVSEARRAIADGLGLQDTASGVPADHPALHRPGATFVTLHGASGRLRGCVGRLEATRSLGADVRANALAAAFADSRFAPLRADEWLGLHLEVSLLDTPEPLHVQSEAEALAGLRRVIDGVIFEWRGARATLLPQVWEQCPEPGQFMAALKRKAGLPADFWARDVQLWRYRVRSFSGTVDELASAALAQSAA